MQTSGANILAEADALSAQGWVYWEKGLGLRALPYYAQAHDLVRDHPDVPVSRQVQFGANHALVLGMTGRVTQALTLWDRLLDTAQKHQLPTTVMIRQKAVAHERNRDLDLAANLLDQITPTPQTSDDDRLKWHNAYGIIDWRQGRLQRARAHFKTAIDVMPSQPATAQLVLACLSNAALLEYEVGRTNNGHRNAEHMEALAKTDQTFATQRGLLRVEAARAQLLGDIPLATRLWHKAYLLVQAQTPDDIEYQFEFATLAASLMRQNGDAQQARNLLSDVLAKSGPEQDHLAVSALTLLADLHLDAGRVKPARKILDRVVRSEAERRDAEREVPLLASLARIADRSKAPDAAILLGKMALATRLRCGASMGFDDITALLAQTKDAALRLTDQLNRRARFAEASAVRRLYTHHIHAAALQRQPAITDPTDLLPFRETEKHALTAWDAIGQGFDPATPTGHDTLEDLKRSALLAVHDILAFDDPAPVAPPLPLPAHPDPNVLRISYGIGRDTLGFVALRGDTQHQGQLAPSAENLASVIAKLRTTINSPEGWDAHARKLFGWLIAPFADLLDGVTRIEIAPSGVLENLPFACLRGPAAFLCEYAPIVILRDGIAPVPVQRDIHLVAFSGQDDTGPDALVAAEKEIEDISQTAPQATTIAASECTRATLVQQFSNAPTHVHFAGHFDLVPTRPSASSLRLGDGDTLYLGELAEPEFSLHGVTLACFAACETGMVEQGAEGFESLAQVVLDQGAQNVIATLWPISDTNAHFIMVAFYNRLFGTADGCVATALGSVQRLAAARLRRALSSAQDQNMVGGIGGGAPGAPPSDWAGFVHYRKRST